MYWVWYYCPAISRNWLPAGGPFDYNTACLQAQVVKPNSQFGRSEVRDTFGRVVYSL